MRKIESWFTIPFADSQFSIAERLAFGTDHLQRMIANVVAGVTPALVTQTTTRLTTLVTCGGTDANKLMLRQAAKEGKNALLAALPRQVGRIATKMDDYYLEPGRDATKITTVFGQGQSFYYEATDDKIQERLQALVTALTPLAGDMGPEALAIAQGLVSQWAVLYAASEAATGSKTASESEKRVANLALAKQLTKNLLLIAAHFVETEATEEAAMAKAKVYFRQSLLGVDTGEEEPVVVGEMVGFSAVAGAETLSVDISGQAPVGAPEWQVFAKLPSQLEAELVGTYPAATVNETLVLAGAPGDVVDLSARGKNGDVLGPLSAVTQVVLN